MTPLTFALTAAEQPELNGSAYLLIGVFIAGFIGCIVFIFWAIDRNAKKGRGFGRLLISVLAVVGIFAVALALAAANANREYDERSAKSERLVEQASESLVGWAEDVYGVTGGMTDLEERHGAEHCPNAGVCFTGSVFVGDTLTPVTLVTVDGKTKLVAGILGDERPVQKELPRIDRQ